MAHYAGVNEKALLNAISGCKSKLKRDTARSLLAEAKALPVEGAGASDNIVKAAKEILEKTNDLYGKLEKIYNVALDIAEYKQIKKELDKTKSNMSKYSNYYNNQDDKTAPIALSYKNKYKSAKSSANNLESKLNALKKSLTAAGYPPV